MTWRTDAKFEEKDSFNDERNSMMSAIRLDVTGPSPAFTVIAECVRLATLRLAGLESVVGNDSICTALNSKNKCEASSSLRTKNDTLNRQAQQVFDLLQAACEVFGHLGTHGSAARVMLRHAGVVDTCFCTVAAIRSFAARRNDEKLGTNALAAAVATLRRVSIVAGYADPNSLRTVPVVYDVLRSQLSRPSIQQQGLQLMHVLGRTGDGAKTLDSMPGSWQWLGRAQFNIQKKGEPYPWVVAKESLANSVERHKKNHVWNATRLANFLNLRGLKQGSSEELQRNVEELHFLALLPFEGESPEAWQIRMVAFETRNRVKFLGSIATT